MTVVSWCAVGRLNGGNGEIASISGGGDSSGMRGLFWVPVPVVVRLLLSGELVVVGTGTAV